MKSSRILLLGFALVLSGCQDSGRGSWIERMEGGAVIYHPHRDDSIHPDRYDFVIVDDVTGYVLRENSSYGMPGHKGWFSGWKITDRNRKPVLYFTTRLIKSADFGIYGPKYGQEIVQAHPDGFFPFENSIYPDQLSFDRIAMMLSIHHQTKGHPVIDNRSAYRSQNEEGARLRRLSPFKPSNFDFDPMSLSGVEIFFPKRGAAKYDPVTKAAMAGDGSRLLPVATSWSTALDRDGGVTRVRARWTDSSEQRRVDIAMVPMRGYREGYGETRAAYITEVNEFLGVEDHRIMYRPVSRSEISGQSLADLINASVPIAARHTGHMIVFDGRGSEQQPWR